MRLAIAGCGIIGDFHAGVADSIEALEVVALVDPVASQREKVAAKHGIDPSLGFDTLAEALSELRLV